MSPNTIDPKSLSVPRDRLIYLRDFLITLPPQNFSMNWGRPLFNENRIWACKGDIGGWAAYLFTSEDSYVPLCAAYKAVGGDYLGLTPEQTDKLFLLSYTGPKRGIALEHAVRVINHLLAEDVVDWSKACDPKDTDHHKNFFVDVARNL